MQIGEKIRVLRKEKRIQQVDLANIAGINLQYLNKIEKGKVTNIGEEILGKIADALGVSLDYLYQADTAIRIGFTPCFWAAPLLNIIIDGSLSGVKLAYSYTNHEPVFLEPDKLSITSNGKEVITTLPSVVSELMSGDDSENKMLSEKDLKNSFSQYFDFLFLPSFVDYEKTNMIPIASICNTVKGGVYAVVFPNNSDTWNYENFKGDSEVSYEDKEQIRKRTKVDFLSRYQNKSDRERFIENSMFFYQKDTIAESFLSEVLSLYTVKNVQSFEIKSSRPNHTIDLLKAVLKGTQESTKKSSSTLFDRLLKEATNSYKYGSTVIPSLLNFSPLSNASLRQFLERIDFSKTNSEGYTVFVGWEPHASLIREAYETENPEKFCIMFNISRLIYPPNNLEILYECFVNTDRLEDLKRNKLSKLFFIELDQAIKRLSQKTSSSLISPEIQEIANILGMPIDKTQGLLRKMNFTLKFYSKWVL